MWGSWGEKSTQLPAAGHSTKLHSNGWEGQLLIFHILIPASGKEVHTLKLGFLLVLISNWFIPSPVPCPYRKAKVCDDQTLETKLQVTLEKVNLNFQSTQWHAKGWKKEFKWQMKRKRKTLCIYVTTHGEAGVKPEVMVYNETLQF